MGLLDSLAGLIPSNVTKKNKYSAVGNGEVIKMEYMLMIGSFDNEPDIPLAYTDSFVEGISLSEIKWGYVNTSNNADTSLGHIEFTLHDIAGKGLANFMKVRDATHYINFRGPDSTGALSSTDAWAKYFPISTDCRIEFSPTQGFTYTLVGRPIVQLAGSGDIKCGGELHLTGAEVEKSSTFTDYLNKVVRVEWNKNIGSSTYEYNISPQIKEFQFVDEDKLKYEDNKAQVTEKKEGKVQAHIKDISFPQDTTIDKVVTDLFNTRFKADADMKDKPKIEVNFVKWQGEGHIIQVRFQDITTEDVLTDIKVCIGDDVNCAGFDYRATLVDIAFNDLMAGFKEAVADGIESKSGDQVQSGNTSNTPVLTAEQRERNGQVKTAKKEITSRTARPMGEGSAARWGALESYIKSQDIPSFKLNIEMPYSFGFTPAALGGKLKDSIKSGTGVGIHYTQGVDLKFFWYVDPDCQSLEEMKVISQSYRITNVAHTIGLNGNTTTVGLSHLHITK